MNNNRKTGKLVAILLLVTMISLVLLSGTYAKYTSSISGEDSAVIAKWLIKVNDKDITQEEDIEFGLFDTILDTDGVDDWSAEGTAEEDVNTGMIAPGTYGKFTINVENASDVTAEIFLEFELKGNDKLNIPIEFSDDDGTTWKTSADDLDLAEAIELGFDSDSEYEMTVLWRWAYEGNGSSNYTEDQTDESDTTIGITAQDGDQQLTVKVTLTATQVD